MPPMILELRTLRLAARAASNGDAAAIPLLLLPNKPPAPTAAPNSERSAPIELCGGAELCSPPSIPDTNNVFLGRSLYLYK